MISQKSILKSLYKSTKEFNIYISRNLIHKYNKAMIKTNLYDLYCNSTERASDVQNVLDLCIPLSKSCTDIHDDIFGIVSSKCYSSLRFALENILLEDISSNFLNLKLINQFSQ